MHSLQLEIEQELRITMVEDMYDTYKWMQITNKGWLKLLKPIPMMDPYKWYGRLMRPQNWGFLLMDPM